MRKMLNRSNLIKRLCDFFFAIVSMWISFCIAAQADGTLQWLGNGRYLCHCLDCPLCRNGCIPGWFGLACQYVDVAPLSLPSPYTEHLTDGNNETCVEDQDQYEAKFRWKNQPYQFIWMRTHFNNANALDLLRVHVVLDLAGKERPHTPCSGRRNVRMDELVMDIYCDKIVLRVSEIILSGAGVGYLCEVHVSGGRNVALRQVVRQKSVPYFKDNKTNEASLVVDGNTDPSVEGGSCSRFGYESTQWIHIIFHKPKRIHRFRLVSSKAIPAEKRMYRFFAFNASNHVQHVHRHSRPVALLWRVHLSITPQVTSVTVKGRPGMSICELEVFGDNDCPPEHWGLDCEYTCKCNGRKCHPSTGVCYSGCPFGFGGYGCATKCSSGWYGRECLQPCPTNCYENSCDIETGTCFGCVLGFIGLYCEKAIDINSTATVFVTPCTYCRYGMCRAASKTCASGCEPGFLGAACDRTCPSYLYGPNCAFECPEGCSAGYCDNMVGTCAGECDSGLSGDMCNESCSGNTYGKDCSFFCSSSCAQPQGHNNTTIPQTCNATNGYCYYGCIEGYTGAACTESYGTKIVQYVTSLGALLLALFTLLGLIFCPCGKKSESKPDDAMNQHSEDQ